MRALLVIESDPELRDTIVGVLGGAQRELDVVSNAAQALAALLRQWGRAKQRSRAWRRK